MKHKLLLVILYSLLFLPQNNFAQPLYSHFIDSTSQWLEVYGYAIPYTGYCNPNPYLANGRTYTEYSVSGDTIISGNHYFKLHVESNDSLFCQGGAVIVTTSQGNNGYIREDNTGKFYSYSNGSDILFWDFNINIGDSLPECKVASIDSVWLGSTPLKRFTCGCGSYYFIIEGVGSWRGLLYNANLCSSGIEGDRSLVCYKKQNQILHVSQNYSCNFSTVSQVENISANRISIYPNPTTDQLFIETNGMTVTEINIYNATGILVSQTRQPLDNYIDISQLADGVYFIVVKTKETSVLRRLVKL
ncbi:MAG TPA: T9SS type A sorting domain-containing protein [Chitinophagales bacterium]|nr:T9SS type A sorting domain-containing protein [Chitinophagales bacterium]